MNNFSNHHENDLKFFSNSYRDILGLSVILLFSVLNHGFFTTGSRTLNLYLFSSSTISHEAFTVAMAVHVTDSYVIICDTGF